MSRQESSPLFQRITSLELEKQEHQLAIRSIDRELVSLKKEYAALLRKKAPPSAPPPAIAQILAIVAAPISEQEIITTLSHLSPQSIHQALEFHTRPPEKRHTKKSEPSQLACVKHTSEGYKEVEFKNKGRGDIPDNLICSRAWLESKAP